MLSKNIFLIILIALFLIMVLTGLLKGSGDGIDFIRLENGRSIVALVAFGFICLQIKPCDICYLIATMCFIFAMCLIYPFLPLHIRPIAQSISNTLRLIFYGFSFAIFGYMIYKWR